MDRERFIELLLKKQQGIITLAEQTELVSLRKALYEDDTVEEDIALFFSTRANFTLPGELSPELSIEKLKARTNSSQKNIARKRLFKRIRIAGIAASIMICFTVLYFSLNDSKGDILQIVATQKGSRSNVVLPDGTKVWLNGASKITYPQAFGTKSREVFLTGEAFFDVTHDKKHPFVVHTKNLNVKVLGTAFNVRAYDEDQTTQTTLLRGAVEISLIRDKEKKIVLKPNEKAIIQNNYVPERNPLPGKADIPKIAVLAISPAVQDSAITETEWVNNKLAFEQETLADIAVALERWYSVEIDITDSAIAAKKYRGRFENKSLQEVLDALQIVSQFQYKINDNQVTISK